MLRLTNDIDPFRNGVVKMARKNVELDQVLLDEIAVAFTNDLLSLPSPHKVSPRLLTTHECLNGIMGDQYILPMNMKTSPGWPYKLDAHKSGKQDFIEGEVGNFKLTAFMERELNELEESYRVGAPNPIFYFDCIKDERRPIAKALSGNSRIFSVGPMHFSMLMRKYTAFFQAHCMVNCITSPSAVGINPHSTDWGRLLDRISSVGTNYIAGDFEKWDKWIPYELFLTLCDTIDRFYNSPIGSPDSNVRRALFSASFGALRIAMSNVYQTNGGMPSGTPGTSIFNSLANKLLMNYAFVSMARIYQPTLNLRYINRLIQCTAYGDDHIVAVSDLVKWFNMVNLSSFFASINIPYTSADKSSSTFTTPYVPLSELTYLKRHFVPTSGFHVLAPLDKDVIKESVMWGHKGGNSDADLINTCSSALLEAVHHGKPWFDNLNRIIASELIKLNICPPDINYRQTLLRIQGDGVQNVGVTEYGDLGLEPEEL
jgi:hypothetical protein